MTTLFIAGWAHSGAALQSLEPYFTDTQNIYISVADCLTAGNSLSEDRRNPALSLFAQGLLRIIALQKPVRIVAWSMGCMVVSECMAQGLLSIPAVFLAPTLRFVKDDQNEHGVDMRNLRGLKRALTSDRNAALGSFYRDCMVPISITDEELESRIKAIESFSTEVLATGLEYLGSCDLRSASINMASPILVMHGEQDAIIPVEAGKHVAAIFGGELHLYPQCGHSLLCDIVLNEIGNTMQQFFKKVN